MEYWINNYMEKMECGMLKYQKKITEPKIRRPAVAGSFYPSNQLELEAFLDIALSSVNENHASSGRLRALISPHAGYMYSGDSAGKGYNCIKHKNYENVIIFAPSHKVPFYGVALSDYTHYKTPLGSIMINTDAVNNIIKNNQDIAFVRNDAHVNEHALEVQLPFIQKILPDVPLIPVICGHIDDFQKTVEAFSEYNNEKNLWIISSDFTHYGRSFNYTPFFEDLDKAIEKLDMQAIKKILDIDPEGFLDFISKTGATICGATPISLLLYSFYKNQEIKKTLLLDYTNSGKLMSDFSHSVSYASIGFFS